MSHIDDHPHVRAIRHEFDTVPETAAVAILGKTGEGIFEIECVYVVERNEFHVFAFPHRCVIRRRVGLNGSRRRGDRSHQAVANHGGFVSRRADNRFAPLDNVLGEPTQPVKSL